MSGYNVLILRKLIVFASISVIFYFFLTNASAAVIPEIQNSDVTKNCLNKDCNEFHLKLTKQINKTLDININPCENIQQFVCGHSKIKSFSEKEELTNDIVNKRVESLVARSGDFAVFRPFKLIYDLYRTCMSYEKTGQQSLDLLRDIIKKLGNWPFLEGDNWKESDFDWTDFYIQSKNIGLHPFNILTVVTSLDKHSDDKPTRYLLEINLGEFKHSAPSETLIAAYKNYIAKVSELLGNTQTSEEIDQIVAFELQLSKFDNKKSVALSFKRFTEEYPSMNWEKYINDQIGGYETPLNPLKSIIVLPSDFSDFVELMEKTPKRVQANFALWKIIQETIPYLTEEYRELEHEYCLTQKCKIEKRGPSCVGVVNRYLSPALELFFATNFYSYNTDAIVTEMVENIREQLVNWIHESTWMSKETKNKGIEIIGNMSFVIGNDNKDIGDDSIFEMYYESLEIDTNNYLQTLLNLKLFNQNLNFYDFVTSNRHRYLSGVIYVPMSMLQEPFFSIKYPMYVNYGYTGKAIADEMVDMIVSRGINGLSNDDLRKIYYTKGACFEQQMTNYTSNNVEHPMNELFFPQVQIGEHIAYKATYRAYQKWLNKNGIEAPLPGLPFLNNQLFWINSIRNSCISSPKKSKVIDNKYSIFDFYKMRAVTNFPEFYKDFNCPTDGSFVKNYGPACTF
ncbi:neprilysin-2-like [Microplitis mediator]|uniref:neprilysin-2-like n=1 Tax=Microplitis mediator TaxID=375433 RepID=UPI00255377F9|nr:neprilysin-2-like [Microplitis mediator]